MLSAAKRFVLSRITRDRCVFSEGNVVSGDGVGAADVDLRLTDRQSS